MTRESGAFDNLCRLIRRMINQSYENRMSSDEKSELDLQGAPRPGAFGRFYLQELINSGGMADIWLATNASNQAFARTARELETRIQFFLSGIDNKPARRYQPHE